MPLSDTVYVERRFQRSIRIDTDLQDPDALTGFICPESSAAVLSTMASHINETGQAAFTWTGPYGSGKSSLVIALSALTAKSKLRRDQAKSSVGEATAENVWGALPPGKQGWTTIPVVGQRASARKVIGDALIENGLAYLEPDEGWNDLNIVQILLDAANNIPGKAGLILIVDEMGKFLEAAARDGSDLYLFQQLAEIASRSNGKLVVIGILHQAFEEYANRLSRDARDEWSKIQGRFVDLAVNTAGEEQIDLLARAIHSKHDSSIISHQSYVTAETIRSHKPGVSESLAPLLENTWPLHPVVAALLGPISRRRFGQNQRSLFGFLNSAEPNGFQDFLRVSDGEESYSPSRLWDYLRINLEPSIIASPDGHRWAMAAEALDRCEANESSPVHIQLLKTIAILDLFRERSGLYPSRELLHTTVQATKDVIDAALEDLRRWSFVIYRKHMSAYAIYAGSDFDIESAIEQALQDVQDVNFETLQRMAGMQPILAKRHYFETGALRWFDVQLGSLTAVTSNAAQFASHQGTIGLYLLALPTEGEDSRTARSRCKEASKKAEKEGLTVIAGFPTQAWTIIELAKELKALEKVREEHIEIQGDLVAQREVNSRLIALQNQLEAELQQAMLNAVWFENGQELKRMTIRALNNKVSDVAEDIYPDSPQIKNELLNRTKPSSSAIAAQNALLKAMANNLGERRLGIKGYPAEGGLFESLLEHTKLYGLTEQGFDFIKPNWENDAGRLHPAWTKAAEHLESNSNRSVGIHELYEIWEDKPIGLKRGLMPVLAVAFILSQRSNLAFYREGIFQPLFTDLDVDYLAKDPASIQVRWMDLSHLSKSLLSGLAEIVRELDTENPLRELAPIDVARGLVAIFDRLPNWTKRTQRLSSTAMKVRTIFKHASDPNQLLFSDLPGVYDTNADIQKEAVANSVVTTIREAMKELVDGYPKMLQRLSSILLTELQVPNDSPQALTELRDRAENIKQMSGDFRLDAFTNRIAALDGSSISIEGVGSLAANKPPRDWVDADLDSAFIETAALAQKFVRTESFARVQGRKDKRHAMAIIISRDGQPKPMEVDFQITESDRTKVDELVSRLKESVQLDRSNKKSVILAALAELSSEYMSLATDTEQFSFLEETDVTE
ncbi:ATP-binding protein [Marinobacter sp.]|uniref:ATP-binding protein n=1 Tax=Marinobacter sp. TaxID=50741 RepID=UPI003A9556B0